MYKFCLCEFLTFFGYNILDYPNFIIFYTYIALIDLFYFLRW